MKKLILNVFNEGMTQSQLNSVRGGASTNGCTCFNGATYDCGCYSDCTCNGAGTKFTCSCNKTGGDNGISNPVT